MPIKYHSDMNKALLFFAFLLVSFKGFSQGGDASSTISYGGHSFGTAYDDDAKLALWSQRLINNQRSIDTFAITRYGHHITEQQYIASLKELYALTQGKNARVEASRELKSLINEYYELQNATSIAVIQNTVYRHYMYVLNMRVMMCINEGMTLIEGWDMDQNVYNLKNTIREAAEFIKVNAIDDGALKAQWKLVAGNPQFNTCNYNITIEDTLFARAGSPSNIEIYIVDQLHYNICKTRYKTDISKGAIPENFRNKQKESNFLKDYLKATLTLANEPMVYNISLGEHVGSKPNSCFASLSLMNDWYIYVFYKGKLYYANALPKGGINDNVSLFIPNKM
jgi:hypothetical protein